MTCSAIFVKDEWSEMANYIHTWSKKPKSMTTKHVYTCFQHLIMATQELRNAPEEFFSMEYHQTNLIPYILP
jgi:hypothetical protein